MASSDTESREQSLSSRGDDLSDMVGVGMITRKRAAEQQSVHPQKRSRAGLSDVNRTNAGGQVLSESEGGTDSSFQHTPPSHFNSGRGMQNSNVDATVDGAASLSGRVLGGKVKETGAKRKKSFQGGHDPVNDMSLIDVIKNHGKLVPQAAKNWVERYEVDSKAALTDLLMMLFEACGVQYQGDEGPVDEIDVDDVVVFLVNQARDGNLEDYLGSKQKDLKNFKDNLLLFWDSLVIECQDGPLFDQLFLEKCMDYVIALSCTPPRVFRRVTTLVGLQLVTSLVTVAKTLGGQRETTQRQLNAEKKKRKDGPRVESLNKTLSVTHEKITMAEEMMRKIFTGLFMHRYRDVDPDIRMACIRAIGSWIVSYPSLFLQDLYLKYLGWTLNDKNPAVRKTSIAALQCLYEVDDNVPSLSLFTERFCNRMIELADDIDATVAVNAIGLLKQLLRHQLLVDDELGTLYDLLIDESPLIRHAVGELVHDHLICQKFSTSQSMPKGMSNDASEVQIGRLLQILREFSADPILSDYVIDAVWEEMKAMKDWKCIISMLLDDNPRIELTEKDATNLVRVLCASVKKAVGEKIVPTADSRKGSLTKAQKEALDNSRREVTAGMIKHYPQMLRKYLADKEKISPLVEIIMHLKLELYSLKRQEQSFMNSLQLIKDAFFKHGEEKTLKSCVKAFTFCASESQADLQDSAQNKLKELEDELVLKLRSAIKQAGVSEDEYSLTVNLKRLYQLQLLKFVSSESLFADVLCLVKDFNNLDDEVIRLVLLNMHLHVTWSSRSIEIDNPSDTGMVAFLSKRDNLISQLEYFTDNVLESCEQGAARSELTSTICVILADLWSLFSEAKLNLTKQQCLGFCPSEAMLKKFWKLCEYRLNAADDDEEEEDSNEHVDEINQKDVVMSAAAKLVAHEMVPKDFLGAEIISHFILHGGIVAETVKHLITLLKKNSKGDDLPKMCLEATKRAYQRHVLEASKNDEDWTTSKSFLQCKELASRLSATFLGSARDKHKPNILKIVNEGIEYAFKDAPKQLPFLEGGVLQFALKLPLPDVQEIIKHVQKRVEGINTDEDPSSWRPYFTFVDYLQEKHLKNEGEREASVAKHHIPRPKKAKAVKGKILFEGQDSTDDEDAHSESDQEDAEAEDDDTPLSHVRQASKFVNVKATKTESAEKARRTLPKIPGKSLRETRTDTSESAQPESGSIGAEVNVAHDLFASATEEQLPIGLGRQSQFVHSGLRAEKTPAGGVNTRAAPRNFNSGDYGKTMSSSSAEDHSRVSKEYLSGQNVSKTFLSSSEDIDDEFVGARRLRL
ncbi:sister-chromatid cohesion protein 3 isoform X2 [Cryptomeria japonica]|uniref:sister-chromatid cohesion protein 3 isoform X2 n=1 Tax=Cryptomeria japonica TaxID=3369 RepID=UPI0027D9DFFD|nr:sister-chromatid cohesion protein 3 isoform X2 [Cryptomeria japonica]